MGVAVKMINDFITGFISIFTSFYTDHIHQHIQDLIDLLSSWEDYESIFNDLLAGVMFICGKPLIVFMVSCFVIIVTIRVIMALVNIIGQFIP